MDEGKLIQFEEKKIQASKLVKITFPLNDSNFLVLDEDGNVKYSGVVQADKPHIDDNCSCPNFKPLNNEKWIATHGYAYQCKHLLRAREERFC